VLAVLERNLADVRRRIEAARARGAHAAKHTDLVVVTKYAPAAAFSLLLQAGVTDVGESRVQAAGARRPQAPEGLTWHGIGHLQRNKAAAAVQVFDTFHALDSVRLAERLESVLQGRARPWPVYIEVNAAGDPAKGGVAPEETLALVKRVAELSQLECQGFMTMARAPIGDPAADEASARQAFGTLRQVRDDVVASGVGRYPPRGLSMGMTSDYPWAVEEGATVVRIGSAVFRGVFVPAEDEGATTPGRSS
jgi:pyridoxal phosphate enzyme (YggS family)